MKVVKYFCGKDDCGWHDTLEAARECALSGVHEEEAWECEMCGTYHDTEAACIWCCSEERWLGIRDRVESELLEARYEELPSYAGLMIERLKGIERRLSKIREKKNA